IEAIAQDRIAGTHQGPQDGARGGFPPHPRRASRGDLFGQHKDGGDGPAEEDPGKEGAAEAVEDVAALLVAPERQQEEEDQAAAEQPGRGAPRQGASGGGLAEAVQEAGSPFPRREGGRGVRSAASGGAHNPMLVTLAFPVNFSWLRRSQPV